MVVCWTNFKRQTHICSQDHMPYWWSFSHPAASSASNRSLALVTVACQQCSMGLAGPARSGSLSDQAPGVTANNNTGFAGSSVALNRTSQAHRSCNGRLRRLSTGADLSWGGRSVAPSPPRPSPPQPNTDRLELTPTIKTPRPSIGRPAIVNEIGVFAVRRRISALMIYIQQQVRRRYDR